MITYWIVNVYTPTNDSKGRYLVPLIGKGDQFKARAVVVRYMKAQQIPVLFDDNFDCHEVKLTEGVILL